MHYCYLCSWVELIWQLFRLTYIIWKYRTVGTVGSPTRPVSLFRWEGPQFFVLLYLLLLTYLLTPWCGVLLEKLTGLQQLVKDFPAFYGTQRFITALNKRPPPIPILAQPNPVHIPTSHLLEIHPNIIHPSTPRWDKPTYENAAGGRG